MLLTTRVQRTAITKKHFSKPQRAHNTNANLARRRRWRQWRHTTQKKHHSNTISLEHLSHRSSCAHEQRQHLHITFGPNRWRFVYNMQNTWPNQHTHNQPLNRLHISHICFAYCCYMCTTQQKNTAQRKGCSVLGAFDQSQTRILGDAEQKIIYE